MNPTIKAAIAKFAAEHPELRTKDGAAHKCRTISGEFCVALHRAGIKEAVVDEMDVVDGVAHKAVRVGDLWIDWTARQYNPNAAFPLIEQD